MSGVAFKRNSGFELIRSTLAERRDVIVSGVSSLLLRIAGLGSTFLLGVILARTLGPTEYGIYGFIIAMVALAMNVALLGTPQLAVRELAARSSHGDWTSIRGMVRSFGRATNSASLIIGLIAVAGILLAAPGDRVMLTYCVIGIILSGTMTATTLAAAELRGLGALFKGQFWDIFGRPALALLLCGSVFLAGSTLAARGALLIQLVVSILAATISIWWIGRALSAQNGDSNPHAERGWITKALPLGVVDVLRQFDGSYGLILMGWLASGSELGVYRVALSASVLVSMPVTILHMVLAPTVSRLFRRGERVELQRLLRFSSAVVVAVLLPMLLGLLLFGRPLIELVFGSVYGGAWLPLVVLCGAQLVFGMFGMGPILLAMADSERHLTQIYLIAVGCGLALAFPMIWLFGAIGAAGAQVFSTGLTAFLSGRFARRQFGLGTTFMTRGLTNPLTPFATRFAAKVIE